MCYVRALLVHQRLYALKTLAKNKKYAALDADNIYKNRSIDIIPGQFRSLFIIIFLLVTVNDCLCFYIPTFETVFHWRRDFE